MFSEMENEGEKCDSSPPSEPVAGDEKAAEVDSGGDSAGDPVPKPEATTTTSDSCHDNATSSGAEAGTDTPMENSGKTIKIYPDSKVYGANMGPIWGQQDPGGPHVGPMNFAIWVGYAQTLGSS